MVGTTDAAELDEISKHFYASYHFAFSAEDAGDFSSGLEGVDSDGWPICDRATIFTLRMSSSSMRLMTPLPFPQVAFLRNYLRRFLPGCRCCPTREKLLSVFMVPSAKLFDAFS